jgi:hypothetical protein
VKREKSGRPKNLDGEWKPLPDMDSYARFDGGAVEVRFHPGFEPDGELVSHFGERVAVHAERMDKGQWSIILTAPDGHDVHIDLWSRTRIHVLWRDEG